MLRLTRCAAALLVLIVMLSAAPGWAQAPSTSSEPSAADEIAEDPYGRTTPQGTVHGFVEALASEDFTRAGQYLDLGPISATSKRRLAPRVARRAAAALDRHGRFLPRAALSGSPTGWADDGLVPELDAVGVLEVGDTSIDLLVERAGSPTAPVWLISSNSLAALSQAGEIAAPRIVDRWLPAELRERKAWGAPVGDWLAMGAIAAGAYGFAWLVVWVLTKINALWRHFRRDESKALFSALATPARLLIALALLAVVSTQVGISIVVREQLGAVLQLIGWTVFAWLLLRTVDVLTTVMIGRLQRKGRGHVASIGLFLGRLAKGAVVVIGVLAVVDTLGYDVTTGLAALGIGGLALALGAQKVVENLVASVSILADRPVRLGEFCKIGDTMGTVEEIGIRSTKLRTLDHTLVVIPNSEFAAKQLENFSRRNRFWFHPVLNIDYRTPPSRIETLLSALRSDLGQMEGFVEHPRVRLLGLAADRLPIEIFGYVDTADNDRFLEFQEAATLRILRLANEIAVTLVPPGVAVYQGGADPAVGEEHKQS